MNTIPSIEASFVHWAQTQDDLRAAFVVGSQARRDHPADAWSDLDIILFVTDVDRRYNDVAWLGEVAPLWLSQDGRTVSGDPERLALFADGIQVDFVFHPISMVPALQKMAAVGNWPDTICRGTRVLFDKDDVLNRLPQSAPISSCHPPTEAELIQTMESFWFSAVYCAKQLCRGELWLFQNGSGGMLWPLLRVIEWQARATHGWDYDTWHAGKFIAEWADAPVYAALQQVYARLDLVDGWRAMQVRLGLFNTLARQLARSLGTTYPEDLEKQVMGSIQILRSPKP